jgi:hypothetical protein
VPGAVQWPQTPTGSAAEFDALRNLCKQGLNPARFVQLQVLLTSLAVLPARTTLKSLRVLDVDAVMRARQRLVRAAVLSYI